jgi:TPP-dependent pyruvate/acetoin dehydrogenase alpha subunit
VDGADLVAIYRVASESFSRARLRRISTLVDCVLEPGSDPVGIMETWLAARGYFTPAVRRKVRAAIARDLSADTA